MRRHSTGDFLGAVALLPMGFILVSCNPPPSPRLITHPANVQMIVNGGADATNDTALIVLVRGDYIDRMVLTTDSLFRGSEWVAYDSIDTIAVPAVEGIVTVFGRFATDGGGTSSVFLDPIEIDLSAEISTFSLSAGSDTLRPGDYVAFEVETGESGRADIAFGRYLSGVSLPEASEGIFRRILVVPDGINDDSVVCSATFVDKVGNQAPAVSSESTLIVRGRAAMPHLISSVHIAGMDGQAAIQFGGVCFVSDRNHTLHLFDVRDPLTPSHMRWIELNDWGGGMTTNEVLLYVADGQSGVAIIGANPPATAGVIGRARLNGNARDVALDGDYLYVASVYTGLTVLDANDWTRPEVISRYQTAGYGEAIIREGSFVYMTGSSGVAIIDVVDPRNPSLISEFRIDGVVWDVVEYEDRLYLATETQGIVIIDIRQPDSPKILYEHPNLGPAFSLTLTQPYLAIGRQSSVTIVNAALPEQLPVVGNIGGLSGAMGICTYSQYLFIAGEGWFYVADLFE